jgi:hypothetical protein
MDNALRERVRKRAHDRCEYCRLHQDFADLRHHIEHIVARKHGGTDEATNLALACHRCNLSKSSNLTGIDPKTGKLTPLFHPRKRRWRAHFRFDGATITGTTAVGRATVATLGMNDSRRIELRAALLELGELD